LITLIAKETADTAEFCGRAARILVVIWNIAVHKYCRKFTSVYI